MSTPPPPNVRSPFDQRTLRYLRRSLDAHHPLDEPFVFSDREDRFISRVRQQTLTATAALGALGLFLLYLPYYAWPGWLADTPVRLFGETYTIPLLAMVYGALLLYLEIHAILWLNTRAVRLIMAACQFPRAHDAQYERHLHAIAEAALHDRGGWRLLNVPYMDVPRWAMPLYVFVSNVLAVLSAQALTLALRRVVERVSLWFLIDVAGMPLFAFWNAWASARLIHETRVRVMAPLTIRSFVDDLHEEWQADATFQSLIADALHYVSVLDRQHNYAHLFLTETLMDRFGLDVIRPAGEFAERLAAAPAPVRRAIERLLIFSVLIDGRFSRTEKQQLRKLRQAGLLTYDLADVAVLGRQFNRGKGLWV